MATSSWGKECDATCMKQKKICNKTCDKMLVDAMLRCERGIHLYKNTIECKKGEKKHCLRSCGRQAGIADMFKF